MQRAQLRPDPRPHCLQPLKEAPSPPIPRACRSAPLRKVSVRVRWLPPHGTDGWQVAGQATREHRGLAMTTSKNGKQTCSFYPSNKHIWWQVDVADVAKHTGPHVPEKDARCQPSSSSKRRSPFLKRGARNHGLPELKRKGPRGQAQCHRCPSITHR